MKEELLAISPVDGRYKRWVRGLETFFSEFALMKARLEIEVEYLIALAESRFTRRLVRPLSGREKQMLRAIVHNFSPQDAKEVKRIERVVAHDVKAIEYFLKRKVQGSSLEDVKEMIHFGLASEDVNNLAYSRVLKEALAQVYLPRLARLIRTLVKFGKRYKELAMLARTHGQPASPTTLGKEFVNFAVRLAERLEELARARFPGKLTGVSGNLNALQAGAPEVDWLDFSQEFVQKLGLEPQLLTTQIGPHEPLADILHLLVTTNNILLDLDRDVWRYVSDGYLRLRVVKGEIGSSVMPHKVNPIWFETSEGNLKVANGLLRLLASEPQMSRLQRDLSDSTLKRNYGVALAHTLIAIENTLEGLNRISPDVQKISAELEAHPEVIGEAIQTILRRAKLEQPYEKLKEFLRGRKVSLAQIHTFIESLDVSRDVRRKLLAIAPKTYTGLAVRLTEMGIRRCEHILTELGLGD